MTDIHERLEELQELGLYRRMRMISGPQGPRVVLDGKPVLLLCSNNYLGLADHPARARGRGRRRDALGRRRRGVAPGVGHDDASTGASRSAWPSSSTRGAALLFGSGYLANIGVVSALAGRGEVVFSDELNHASIIDGCRLARAETFVYRHADVEHLAWGAAPAPRAAAR